jgi:hypothetical protein
MGPLDLAVVVETDTHMTASAVNNWSKTVRSDGCMESRELKTPNRDGDTLTIGYAMQSVPGT